MTHDDDTIQRDARARRWLDELLLELRLRDVDGDGIGDVLAEVESHVTASGRHPAEEFGTPATYAAAVVGGRAAPSGSWLVGGLLGAGFALGAVLTFTSLTAMAAGGVPAVATGPLLGVAAAAAVGTLAARRLDLVLRHPAVAWVIGVVAVVVVAVASRGLDGALPSVAPWTGTLLGTASLLACAIGIARSADPVVDPRRRGPTT